MSGEKCPLKANLYWGAKEKAWLASPILGPCVLPLGHKGPCSSTPAVEPLQGFIVNRNSDE